MTTTWHLVPISNGPHILTRIFADTVFVGDLTLRREDYADLAARLGAPQAFDTTTGRPITVTSTARGTTASLLEAINAFVRQSIPQLDAAASGDEPDLHELHPQPGEPPAAPVPDGVDGWVPGAAEAGERTDDGEPEGEDPA